MHNIIYFDLNALIIFIILVYSIYTRKMTHGNTNRMFLFLVWTSLIATFCDCSMELIMANTPKPMPFALWFLANLFTYGYFSGHSDRSGT